MPLNDPSKKKPRFDAQTSDGAMPPRPGALASHLRAEQPADANRTRLSLLPVNSILPDPAQPRRALPVIVRQGIKIDSPDAVQSALATWNTIASNLIAKPIQPEHFIMASDEVIPLLENVPDIPIVTSLLDLYALAADILRSGQNDAIDVTEAPNGYRVVAGERRWLAFNLLQRYADANKFRLIEAEILNQPDPWRQASENGNRRPLNAVSMSRQIALLIMQMYPTEDFGTVDETAANDRAFYSQVADGNQFRVKRGYGKRILDVTGLKSPDMLRKYRGILNVNDTLWRLADTFDYTEFRIREAADKLGESWFFDRRNTDIYQIHAELEQTLAERRQLDTVTTVTVSPDNPPSPNTTLRDHDRTIYDPNPAPWDDPHANRAPLVPHDEPPFEPLVSERRVPVDYNLTQSPDEPRRPIPTPPSIPPQVYPDSGLNPSLHGHSPRPIVEPILGDIDIMARLIANVENQQRLAMHTQTLNLLRNNSVAAIEALRADGASDEDFGYALDSFRRDLIQQAEITLRHLQVVGDAILRYVEANPR